VPQKPNSEKIKMNQNVNNDTKLRNKVRKIYSTFIDGIIENLKAGGINAGYTCIGSAADKNGIPTIMPVIARKKEGWKGKLPFDFKYDRSEKGILMRVYNFFHVETNNDRVLDIVNKTGGDYFDSLHQLAEENGTYLRKEGFLVEKGLNLQKVVSLEGVFVD